MRDYRLCGSSDLKRLLRLNAVGWFPFCVALAAPLGAQTTRLVADINPGTDNSAIQLLTAGKTDDGVSVAYFTAIDGSGVRKLWRSDGTPAGTYALSEQAVDSFFASPQGGVYFSAATAERGVEPFRSDGASQGVPLPELVPGPASGSGGFFPRAFGGKPVFRHATQNQVWQIVDAGYVQIAQLPTGGAAMGETMGMVRGSSSAQPVFVFGGAQGTGSYVPPDAANPSSSDVPHLVAAGGMALCGKAFAGTGQSVLNCFRPGSRTFAQVVPNETGTLLRLADNVLFTPFAGRLTFRTLTNPLAWITDGTNAGTYSLSDVAPDFSPGCFAAGSDSRLIFVRAGDLWIAGAQPLSARELLALPTFEGVTSTCETIEAGAARMPSARWRNLTYLPIGLGRIAVTDGTSEGTRTFLTAGDAGRAATTGVAFLDSRLLYSGIDPASGTELWALDPILLFDDSFD